VITPRRTRLVRVQDLHGFRHAIAALVGQASQSGARDPTIVVPTRGAARQLLRLLDPARAREFPAASAFNRDLEPLDHVHAEGKGPTVDRLLGPGKREGRKDDDAHDVAARAGADIVTRDELYDRFHTRLEHAPRRLTSLERDVLMQRAAREAVNLVPGLPFRLRPGLVAEMLRFYDHLRRQFPAHGAQSAPRSDDHSKGSNDSHFESPDSRFQWFQQVNRFEELMSDALGRDEDSDRGARRLRDQTRFLATAFRSYEQFVRESGACDEHVLRDLLVTGTRSHPIRQVIVTVPDWIADPDGLYVADFDLLARIPGLEMLDIVATETLLRSGLDERLHNWWPGIEEISGVGPDGRDALSARPVIVTPVNTPSDEPWWTFRDREEELVWIARQIKADRRNGVDTPLERRAIVFKAPLPYLYLAAEVFPAAGIPYQTCDALPLAVEPIAAALDLVLDAVTSRFARNPLVSLLRSPHFRFVHDGSEISPESISALNLALSQRQYLGALDRLQALTADWNPRHLDAIPALQASLAAAQELAPLVEAHPASEQVRRLQSFWETHLRSSTTDTRSRFTTEDAEGKSCSEPVRGSVLRVPDARVVAVDVPFYAREQRTRAAIAHMLSELASVHAACDDPAWTIDDLAIAVRQAFEDQTFEPVVSSAGVHLVDEQSARYGGFDEVAIVGVVESDWPERPRRNIFYPSALLRALGWPSERDRRAASDARFLDLVASASKHTVVSTFTLDDDALVSRSMQLDEIPRAHLSTVTRPPTDHSRVFLDEALSLDPPVLDAFQGTARAWAALRMSRSPAASAQFHGQVCQGGQVGQVGRGGRGGQVGQGGRGGQVGQIGRVGEVDPPDRPDLLGPALTVSAVETYLDCPFKFFAQHVLRLEDEPEDEEVMDPKRQGRFMHEVFETFFKTWQASGERAITPGNLDRARALFTAVVDRALERLPAAEAGLERTRLLGSPAAAGLGDAVLRMEAERPVPVIERLLEHDLRGSFSFATRDGMRAIALRGKADRVDLLEDGTFRLIDYKLGWPPNRARALQLPIYGVCAEQRLVQHRGRRWRLGEAVYLAFKGPRRVVPLFASDADRLRVLADAQQRLVETVDAIAGGDFPPAPDDVWRCETCSFSSVCRKDYVGDV
jgi:RecB family exonuclease